MSSVFNVDQAILGLYWCVLYLCLVCARVMLTPLPVAISVWEPEQPRQDVEHRPINKSHLQWVTLHAASGERDTENVGGGKREWRRVGEEQRGQAKLIIYDGQCLMPVTSPNPTTVADELFIRIWQLHSEPEASFWDDSERFCPDERDLLNLPSRKLLSKHVTYLHMTIVPSHTRCTCLHFYLHLHHLIIVWHRHIPFFKFII